MKKKTLILMLCLCLCSSSISFADISTRVESDVNSIKVSGKSADENIMLYLLRPNNTVEDMESAFRSGSIKNTVAHYRQLKVLNGEYEYTIVMSDTDEKGKYLLCVGDKSKFIYYLPIEDRLLIASQITSAQQGSEIYEIINENKQYLDIDLRLFDALSDPSLVGELTYQQLKNMVLDGNNGDLFTTVITKINQSIMIAALNDGLISNEQDVQLSPDTPELSSIIDLKDKIKSDGKNELIKNLSKQNFSSYAVFVNALKTQIILQAINHPTENNSDFLLNILTQYYGNIGLDLSNFNLLTSVKKATAVSELSRSKCTVSNIAETFNKIVDSLSSTASGGPLTPGSSDSDGMKTGVSDIEKSKIPSVSDVFSDLSEYEWAVEAVEFLAKKSIISGYSDGSFMPANNITRAEFITIVVRALYPVSTEYEQVFDDVTTESWAFAYIMCAYEHGIISGVDKSHFNPDSSITREDMAKVLYNIISISDNITVEDYDMFDDDETIADYAKDAVYGLRSVGIINGMANNNFGAKVLATRVEASQLIYNFIVSQYGNVAVTKQTEEKADVSGLRKDEKTLNLLISMGIIDDILEFNFNAVIKKGYFAQVVAYIKGMSKDYEANGEVFEDVSSTNEYAPAIEFLAQFGILGKDDKFYPNEPITLSEAVKLLLDVTDYSYFAEANGGYPNGYYIIAAKKNLLLNVECDYDDALVGADMLPLLYNTLKLNIVNFKGTQGYEENTALTILEKWHNVFSQKGIIVANSVTTFYSESDLRENSIQLKSDEGYINFNCGITDIANEIGSYVTLYYRYDDDFDSSVCLYYDRDNRNDIVTINIDDVRNISDSSISYYEDEYAELTELNFVERPVVIYNGTYFPEGEITREFLDDKTGEISIIDNNGDGNFEILRILAYETYVINNVSSKNSVLYDKYDNTKSINIDEDLYDKYSLVFVDGTKAVIEDLLSKTVVSVAANSAECKKRVISMIVSDNKISGIITEIEEVDDKTTITLDSFSKYEVFRKAKESLPLIGNGIVAHIDAFSKIAYVNNDNSGMFQYGLVIESSQEKGISKKINMKIYGSSLRTEVYPLASTVIIDGKKCENLDEAYTKISNVAAVVLDGKSLPAGVFPVRYILNANNEILELDTSTVSEEEEGNSLTYLKSGTNVYSSDWCIGYTLPVNFSTICITINTSDVTNEEFVKDDRFLSYSNASTLSTGSNFHYAAYGLDSSSPYVGLIIMQEGMGVSDNQTFLMVNRILNVYDGETDEILSCIEGVQDGAPIKIIVSKKYENTFKNLNLVQGDVIRYKKDSYGHIINIDGSVGVVKYNKDAKTVTLNTVKDGDAELAEIKRYNRKAHVFHGYVKSRVEGLIEFIYASGGDGREIDIRPQDINWDDKDNILFANIESSTPVIVYDASENESKRVYSGTYDDIADKVHNGNEYSRVLIRYRNSRLMEVVVFNDAALMN